MRRSLVASVACLAALASSSPSVGAPSPTQRASSQGVFADMVAGFVPLQTAKGGVRAWAGFIAQRGAAIDDARAPHTTLSLILCRKGRVCEPTRTILPDSEGTIDSLPGAEGPAQISFFHGTDPDLGKVSLRWSAWNSATPDSIGSCDHRWSRYRDSYPYRPNATLYHNVIGVRAPWMSTGMYLGGADLRIGKLHIPPRLKIFDQMIMPCGFVIRGAWAQAAMYMRQPPQALRR